MSAKQYQKDFEKKLLEKKIAYFEAVWKRLKSEYDKKTDTCKSIADINEMVAISNIISEALEELENLKKTELASCKEIAIATKKAPRWLNEISKEFIDLGIAQRVGKILVFLDKDAAINYIENRPETRGRKKQKYSK